MLTEPGEIDDRDLDTAAPPAAPETLVDDAGTTPDTPASSPGTDATEDAGPKTLAEAIEKALDGEAEPEDPEAKAPVPDPKPADTAAPADAPKEPQSEPDKVPDDDPTDDELKAMRPGARRRVTELLSQRNTARRERDDFAGKLQAAEADATNYREVTAFMAQARLEPAEVRELFDIGAKLKSADPKQLNEALSILLPLTTGLLELTGRAVPADLKSKVDAGEMTEEIARQMARDRATARMAQQTTQRVTSEVAQQQRRAQQTNYQTAISGAVDSWVQGIRKTDLDFDRKSQAMEDAAYAILMRRGPPQSPEQAVEYAKEAYARVNANFRAAAPRPVATRPSPSGSSGNRSGLTPAPKTLEEAILGAMRPAS